MEKKLIVIVGIALLLLVLLSTIFPEYFNLMRKSTPNPINPLPIAELPEPFLLMHALGTSYTIPFKLPNPTTYDAALNTFNVHTGYFKLDEEGYILDTAGAEEFVSALRQHGKLYAYARSMWKESNYIYFSSTQEMYDYLKDPLDSNGKIGSGVPYGFDAIVIDEAPIEFCGINGNPPEKEIELGYFVESLQLLRAEFPEQFILVYSQTLVATGRNDDGSMILNCSVMLNAINDYADVFLPELYFFENSRSQYFRYNFTYDHLATFDGLLEKSFFTLLISNTHPFFVDNIVDIGIGHHLDDQLHYIKTTFPLMNDGIAFWSYYRAQDHILNSVSALVDHYYIDNSSDFLGGEDLSNELVDGSFESGDDWEFSNSARIFDYSDIDDPGLLKHPTNPGFGLYREEDDMDGYINLRKKFILFGNLPNQQRVLIDETETNSISQRFNVDMTGGVYYLKFYVYPESRSSYYLRTYDSNNPGDVFYSNEIRFYDVEDKWQPQEHSFFIPPDVDDATIEISVDNNYFMYLDFVQMEKVVYGSGLTGFCGEGLKECECGDTLVTDYVLSVKDPITQEQCIGDGLKIGLSDVSLDCGGNEIMGGDGRGKGIYLNNVEDVNVQSCVIQGFKEGVYLDNANNIDIRKNAFRNNGRYGEYGVYITSGREANIENNFFENVGVDSWKDEGYHKISRNVFKNVDTAIYLYSSSVNNIIKQNDITSGTRGISVGSYNEIIANTLRNQEYSGILVNSNNAVKNNRIFNVGSGGINAGGSDNSFEDNYIDNAGRNGFSLYYGVNNILKNNVVKNANENGIEFESVVDSELVGNKVFNSYLGFYITNSSGIILDGNEASDNNLDGFYVVNSNGNILENNEAIDNGLDGFSLEGFNIVKSSDNIIINNVASNNKRVGFRFYELSNSIISENTAELNRQGFVFDSSYHNEINYNSATSNKGSWGSNKSGFMVLDSSGSSFDLSFVGNKVSENENYGFYVVSSNHSFLENVASNQLRGFYFRDGGENNLIGNLAEYGESDGFYLERMSDVLLMENVARFKYSSGFDIRDSSSFDLINNIGSDNSYIGFEMRNVLDFNLVRNKANSNDFGFSIRLLSGQSINLEDNEAFNNEQVGFMVSGKDSYWHLNGNMACNTLYYDFDCGAALVDGKFNRFGENNIYECSNGWPEYGTNYLYCTDCEDGTLNGQCSNSRPLQCSEGELIDNCQVCGCPGTQKCLENGKCLDKGVEGYARER